MANLSNISNYKTYKNSNNDLDAIMTYLDRIVAMPDIKIEFEANDVYERMFIKDIISSYYYYKDKKYKFSYTMPGEPECIVDNNLIGDKLWAYLNKHKSYKKSADHLENICKMLQSKLNENVRPIGFK